MALMVEIILVSSKSDESGDENITSSLSVCYRCLGPPIIFLTPILSAAPHPVGHDHKQWGDLLQDLRSVYRWQCSEHHLLKRLSPLPYFTSHFIFFFRLIYFLVSMITSHIAFSSSCWRLCIGMIMLPSPLHNHAYCYVSSLFTYCYIDCDSNNWHFCANPSSGVLLVWDGDSACIGDMRKPSSPATLSWLWPRVLGSSYQPLRYWQSHASSEWASIDTCWLLRDNSAVLSSSSKKASRSKRLQSKWRMIST